MSGTVRSISKALYAVAILGIAVAAAAQSPLDQDWHQWSSDVCMKILTDSPWVTTAQPQDPKNVQRAVLISSLLVREAMLREMQIHQKYDTMSPEKRQEFDKQTAHCVSDSLYSQVIVVRVWTWPPVDVNSLDKFAKLSISDRSAVGPTFRLGVPALDPPASCGSENFPWQHVLTAMDKEHDDWNRAHPGSGGSSDFQQPTYELFYPKSVAGKSLIQPGDRTMVLNWGEKGDQFTFHLADLIYKDKLDF